MRSLFDRLGGRGAIGAVVDDFYVRLTSDPRVLHHFDPERLPSLREAQVAWMTVAFGGTADRPVADLAEAHRGIDITDDQVTAVLEHLAAAMHAAEIDPELHRQAMSVVGRLWHARIF